MLRAENTIPPMLTIIAEVNISTLTREFGIFKLTLIKHGAEVTVINKEAFRIDRLNPTKPISLDFELCPHPNVENFCHALEKAFALYDGKVMNLNRRVRLYPSSQAKETLISRNSSFCEQYLSKNTHEGVKSSIEFSSL